MVSSSKKKRGKQRKAAKIKDKVQSTQEEDDDDGTRINFSPNGDGRFNVEPKHYNRIVHFVKMGRGPITELLCLSHDLANFSFEDSGVLTVLLLFLQRCEDETFDSLINNDNHNLDTPSTWVRLLHKAANQEEKCHLQIAKNIGPLVKCMCNDTERLFFKSNNYWRDTIYPFAELIYVLIRMATVGGSSDKATRIKVTQALLEHECLLRSIVQWQFWGEQYRPDITKELGIMRFGKFAMGAEKVRYDVYRDIIEIGRITVSNLIQYVLDYFTDDGYFTADGRELLQLIGTTPILSKAYDSSCMVSYVAELIRGLKTAEWEERGHILRYLVGSADCVDKGVITEMIDFGLNFVDNYDRAKDITTLSSGMVQQWISIEDNKSEASDTRVSCAIRAGLVEMCLSFIGRFHEHEYFWKDVDSEKEVDGKESLLEDEDDDDSDTEDESIFSYIDSIFEHINDVSLHQKTVKAIRNKRLEIEEVLVSLEGNERIASNPKCKKLLDMIRSMNLNGSYCCRCNKSLSKTEVKLCNGCGCMVYCSRTCQKEDWLNGHSVTCCKPFTDATAGQFQGRYEPELPEDERAASKLKELEVNVNMIQLKLFLDNSETILNQAKALELPLYDCVVAFDLKRCPPTVKVVDYRKNLVTRDAIKGFKKTSSEENIACDFYSLISSRESDEDGDIQRLIQQRLFPHEWLMSEKKEIDVEEE